MPGVTEQEIAQAKQMNLYQYMQLCEPGNFKPEGPGQFRHKGHSSLTFAEDGSWTYFKTKATGRTALNYLIEVEGVSFVEAVREINRIQGGVRPSFQPVKAPPPPAEKKPAKEFKLPRPDKNNYAATAYLRKRCIHPNVLTVCKQKKILYQTSFKDHPNCVFVGRDGNGEPKGGSLRGCSQIKFRRDIPGSKKIYPFYIEAAANADTVEVYEAPIDAMSGASLKIMQHTGNWRGVHYLALGGTDYAALDAFLTYYPNITHIVLCLDNDEAGRTRTQDIIKHLEGNGKTVEDRPPPIGKDYNDTLVQVTQEYQKYRIYNHFQQKKTEKETVAFLKKEYGIGGFSWTFADGGSGFVNFDGKGFSILYDFKDDLRYEKKLKWKDVGKRLEYLVRMDRYLTDAEREKMPAWISRQAESKPLSPPIPDKKPVCETGSTVYLENDQRFTVESIGQDGR